MRGYPNIKRLMKRLRDKTWRTKVEPDDMLIFSGHIIENRKILENILGDSPDIMFREFKISHFHQQDKKALLLSINGLIDEKAIHDHVIEPLLSIPNDEYRTKGTIKDRISLNEVQDEECIKKAVDKVLKGNSLLLIEGETSGLLINASKYEARSIEEPVAEQTIRGARDGFIESTSVNISLLRQRIAHPSLQFKEKEIGQLSKTTVTIAYMKGIVHPDLLDKVIERIKQVNIDSIKSSGDMEQYIEDHPYTIFPTIGNTSRPDKAVSLLLEGRILIFINGSPISLFVPHLFVENMQNIEDYNSRPFYSSFIRMIRFFAFIIGTTFPALYIGALNFHKEVIPSDMIVPIVQARELVPFPLAMEIILTILMFEVVREAGIRLPQQIGAALSIVGALILGEVAVSAGLFGAPTVIVVSIAFIASFVINPISDVTSLLRIIFFVASSLFGAYGLFLVFLATITHMVSLTSVGVPYMAPFAPFYFSDWKDALLRLPARWMKQRPRSIPNVKSRRVISLPKTGGKQ